MLRLTTCILGQLSHGCRYRFSCALMGLYQRRLPENKKVPHNSYYVVLYKMYNSSFQQYFTIFGIKKQGHRKSFIINFYKWVWQTDRVSNNLYSVYLLCLFLVVLPKSHGLNYLFMLFIVSWDSYNDKISEIFVCVLHNMNSVVIYDFDKGCGRYGRQ
jgi:hypothetical protein